MAEKTVRKNPAVTALKNAAFCVACCVALTALLSAPVYTGRLCPDGTGPYILGIMFLSSLFFSWLTAASAGAKKLPMAMLTGAMVLAIMAIAGAVFCPEGAFGGWSAACSGAVLLGALGGGVVSALVGKRR